MMLVNFCDICLRTDVTCSTVCSEGYEVSNLVNNSDKGFLAYPCIKPPVHLDFVFICNIQISHVIIWPQIGAQKSCGFQLSIKSSDTNNQPFTNVSTAFLRKEDLGIIFYRRDIATYTDTFTPQNFAQQCIKPINVTNYVNVLRLSILKTDNSVPAVNKIEIWGRVSPKCGKDVAMNVTALWMNRMNNSCSSNILFANSDENKKQEKESQPVQENLLNVPEDFLDPITFDIMTQPIILPSGKIIDQKTLERHGHNEAVWGRPVSDPFTGIRFNDIHKPIAALPLKARIDKFLLENSNKEEIKKLPRVLGSKIMSNSKSIEVITCVPKNSVNSTNTVKSDVNRLKRRLSNEDDLNIPKKPFRGHLLPAVCLRNSVISSRNSAQKISKTPNLTNKSVDREEICKQNAAIEEKLNTKIQVSSTSSCKCCGENVFYKLPCKHIICRKALISLKKNVCTICETEFKSSDPQRFHLVNVN